MNDKIFDLALRYVDNPTLDAWVFTNEQLKEFSSRLISECVIFNIKETNLMADDLLEKTKNHFGL